MANTRKKTKELEQLRELVTSEIMSSEILRDDAKPAIVTQILTEIKNQNRHCWFNCKMILFTNRYDTVGKDLFFDWLYSTHLRNLIELQGGTLNGSQS